MYETIGNILNKIDDLVWGIPLIVLILAVGIFLTIRLRGLQFSQLAKAIKLIKENEQMEKTARSQDLEHFARRFQQQSEQVILSELQQRL